MRRLEGTWLAEFAGAFDAKPIPVAITWGDFTAPHDELNTRLDVYRGKTTSGTTVFDTREYTKADGIADLLIEDEFRRETSDLEPLSVDLLLTLRLYRQAPNRPRDPRVAAAMAEVSPGERKAPRQPGAA